MDAQHGVFIPTLTGPLTPAHFILLCISWRLSDMTNGTRIIILDDEATMLGGAQWRVPIGDLAPEDKRPAWQYWEDRMREDLAALDLSPSDPDELQAAGVIDELRAEDIDMDSGFLHETDFDTLTNHYYREYGYERRFGPWLPDYPIEDGRCWDCLYLYRNLPSNLSVSHPYMVLRWAIAEMLTKRTFVIDGMDLTVLIGQVIEYEKGLVSDTGWVVPEHYLMPVIKYRNADGGVRPLSASHHTLPMREAIDAGATKEDLLEYMLQVLGGPNLCNLRAAWEDVGPNWVQRILGCICPEPIINHEDWYRFIETGQVRKPKGRKKDGKYRGKE